MILRSVL
ncbi:hypothetical protein LINGRAHAP2_LOCUS34539 [Linum grandiflorum]